MIAHHATLTSIGVELAIVLALIVLFGTIAWRERRRRAARGAAAPAARMRDDEPPRDPVLPREDDPSKPGGSSGR